MRRLSFKAIACGVLVLLSVSLCAFAVRAIVDEVEHGSDRRALERLQTQVANVKAGKQDTIWFDNEIGDVEPAEFGIALRGLKTVGHFQLRLEYSHNLDAIFKEVRGLPGLTVVIVYKSDLTDKGMEYLATLPDLERLLLVSSCVTDKGIQELASTQKLKHLTIQPRVTEGLTVPAIVSLPITSILIEEPYEEDWLKTGIEEIEVAPTLQTLSLYCPKLSAAAVECLRSKVPNCKVRAFDGTNHEANEILPIPDN